MFVCKQSKPKDIPFTVMCDKEKQKFPSLEKLKVAAFLVGKIKWFGWFSDNRVIDRLIAAALNNSALIKLQYQNLKQDIQQKMERWISHLKIVHSVRSPSL